MNRRILKIVAVFAAGVMILGNVGCGAKGPTTANDITDDEQQKLTISSEIVTAAEETEINVD
jgi:hypothetical protein